jgi:hypothetical protein
MAQSNHPDAGRSLLDSIVRATPPSDSLHAEALYWRAALASSAADAERLYGRLVVEAPLSDRAEDALLQLAQLQEARGDRRGAIDRLQRYMLLYSSGPERPRAAVWLVQLLFDDYQITRGCEALRVAREAVPAENVELRNRLEYYASRCVNPPPDTAARPAAAASTRTPSSFYSVQIAAYDSKTPAESMAKRLVARGIDARVDGTVRPFRVRIGKYHTRAAAAAAAATLKKQGITGFIAQVTAPNP